LRPNQLRHAHAVEMAREGVPLNVIQRQLGHSDLGVTSLYLSGISNDEVINAVHADAMRSDFEDPIARMSRPGPSGPAVASVDRRLVVVNVGPRPGRRRHGHACTMRELVRRDVAQLSSVARSRARPIATFSGRLESDLG